MGSLTVADALRENTSIPVVKNTSIPVVKPDNSEKTGSKKPDNPEKTGSKEGLAREPEYVINENITANLVDWLIEVHHKFELRQETLYLTINIVTDFLSTKEVPRKELRLVGIATMLIACRYEEVLAPEVNDLLQLSEESYEREQVFAMEKAILGKLLHYWTVPTPYMLHTRYVKASAPVDVETEKMVCFLAELGMMNYFEYLPPNCYSPAYSPAPGLGH